MSRVPRRSSISTPRKSTYMTRLGRMSIGDQPVINRDQHTRTLRVFVRFCDAGVKTKPVSGGMSVVHCGGPGTAGPPALDGGEWSWQSRKWSQDENHVGCQGWRSIGISRAPDPAIDVQ